MPCMRYTRTPNIPLQRDVTPHETSPVISPDPATLQQLITVLQWEHDAAHTREEAAREREALLLQMLQQLQQQNQRLLDMPRSIPAPAPPVPRAPSALEDPRGHNAPAHCGFAPGASRRPHT